MRSRRPHGGRVPRQGSSRQRLRSRSLPSSPLRRSSGLLADREADLAALDLGVQDFVVEGLSGVGLEKDLSPRLLDDLVLLGRNGGDGDLERTFRRGFRPGGDPEPRAVPHLRRGDEALAGLGGPVGGGGPTPPFGGANRPEPRPGSQGAPGGATAGG